MVRLQWLYCRYGMRMYLVALIPPHGESTTPLRVAVAMAIQLSLIM